MARSFEALHVGETLAGPNVVVTRETVGLFGGGVQARAGDDPVTRMITDWARPLGAIHRRLDIGWLKPVQPGDTIMPAGLIRAKRATDKSRHVLIDVTVRNRAGDKVAAGEAMVEFPRDLICP